MQLAFVPLYIKFMGIESYGLVGFFGTLMATLSVLDMGLNGTLNREMAMRSALPGQEQTSRDLLRTVEVIYWSVALILGALIVLLAPAIAANWIKSSTLAVTDIQQTLMIMGLVVVMRWPFALYQGGLMGLQKQVLVNGLNSLFATFRGLGAIAVLWMVAPSIKAFFWFQVLASSLETLAAMYFLWSAISVTARRSRFRISLLREIRGYATAMMGIGVAATVMTQIDKIVISKFFTLDLLGYYCLAWTVGTSLIRFASPISSAIFPRFAQLVSIQDSAIITNLYHKSAQLMSVVILPLAAVIGLYSHEVLFFWTGIPKVANETGLVTAILILGSVCNAVNNIPLAMQLAYGWISLPFWTNVVAAMLFTPVVILLIETFGLPGAGLSWLFLNLVYVLIQVPIMHQRILKGELFNWCLHDIVIPGLGALAPVMFCKIFLDQPSSKTGVLFLLGVAWCLSFLCSTVAASCIRQHLATWIDVLIARFYSKCINGLG